MGLRHISMLDTDHLSQCKDYPVYSVEGKRGLTTTQAGPYYKQWSEEGNVTKEARVLVKNSKHLPPSMLMSGSGKQKLSEGVQTMEGRSKAFK